VVIHRSSRIKVIWGIGEDALEPGERRKKRGTAKYPMLADEGIPAPRGRIAKSRSRRGADVCYALLYLGQGLNHLQGVCARRKGNAQWANTKLE